MAQEGPMAHAGTPPLRSPSPAGCPSVRTTAGPWPPSSPPCTTATGAWWSTPSAQRRPARSPPCWRLRSLLHGADPVRLMAGAWVDGASLDAMRERSDASPLSGDALRSLADHLLGVGAVPDDPTLGQATPIRISMALASLGGLGYRIRSLESGAEILANTYVDWFTVEVDPATPADRFRELTEPALASSANPLGFPAVRYQRTANELEQYRENGIVWVPDDGWFWYTDRGTVENEPLGRTIDVVQASRPGRPLPGERRYLLITRSRPWPAKGGSGGATACPSGPRRCSARSRSSPPRPSTTTCGAWRRSTAGVVWTNQLVDLLGDAIATLDGDARRSLEDALVPRLRRLSEQSPTTRPPSRAGSRAKRANCPTPSAPCSRPCCARPRACRARAACTSTSCPRWPGPVSRLRRPGAAAGR